MADSVFLREAIEADIPQLVETARDSYRDAFKLLLSEGALAKRDRAYFEMRFRESLEKLIVAEQGGAIAGFMLMTGENIDMFFVDPKAQSRGIGKAMIAHAEALGAKTLECFAANAPARAFYERRGWTLDQSRERAFEGAVMSFVTYRRP